MRTTSMSESGNFDIGMITNSTMLKLTLSFDIMKKLQKLQA